MNNQAIPNIDLIKKYDVSLPRYTSYPSAPNFRADFSVADYQQQTQLSNETLLPLDLSLYVHIPFCHSLCYFCGCNKVVTQRDNKKVRSYLEQLTIELALKSKLFDKDRQITQIHFGGGTPNFIAVSVLSELLDQLSSYFHFSVPSKMDISIEIDPRYVNASDIEQLANAGFNRFSIGVQDFSPEVQKAVNRIQPESRTLEIISATKAVSESVNVDLIVGLPKQTLTSFESTLDKIVAQDVDRVAAYNFAYLPTRIKAQRQIDPSDLPSAAIRTQLNHLTQHYFNCAGYSHIGLDHYAKPDDSLAIALKEQTIQRNFQGYTTHKNTDLVGMGVSAISKIRDCYAQNASTLSQYHNNIERLELPISRGITLNDNDKIRAYLIQEIMCRGQVDLTTPIANITKTSNNQIIADLLIDQIGHLKQFEDDGFLSLTHNSITVNPLGRYFLRQIAAEFDDYLKKPTESCKIVEFSRAV